MIQCVHTVPSMRINDGGPPRSVSQLCGALVRSGVDVALITSLDPECEMVDIHSDIKLRTSHSVNISGSTISRFKSSGFGRMVEEFSDSSSNTLVHQHGIWLRSSHDVTNSAIKSELPLIVSPRGMLEPWALNHRKWKKKLAWTLYQKRDLEKVTAFHATAVSEAESIRRLGFKQPIAVIPNGIQLPKAADGRWDIVGGRSKMENGNSELRSSNSDLQRLRTALFLSRINPKKGLPMLLDAWKKLAPEDWWLLIAGNDDSNHLPVLERQIAELGLAGQVELVGPLFGDDKEQAYLNADLFVLPSYSENFGIVVTEALGYQVPVLTTTGCPWQELESERCAY